MTVAPSSSSRGLSVASLEIGRVLAERDGVTFRVQGTCMYPVARPGDALRIRPCTVAEVKVGDIAVCRTPEYLFGHRVVETGRRDGRAYIVTRPDRAESGVDAPTFDDDLLGVVVDIRRDGTSVPLLPVPRGRVIRVCHRVRLAITERWPRAKAALATVGGRLQATRIYNSLGRRWLAARRDAVRFAVRIPVAPSLDQALYREVDTAVFDLNESWNGRPIEAFTVVVGFGSTRVPAGWAGWERAADDRWRVVVEGVRDRYRGIGLERLLASQGDAILKKGRRGRTA